MKFIIALFALLLSLPSCCSRYRERTPAEIGDRATYVDHLIKETVALTTFRDDDGNEVAPDASGADMYPYCAGVWISKTTFLTAHHCVEDLRGDGKDITQEQRKIYEMVGLPIPGTPIGALVYYSTRSDVSDSPIKMRLYHKAKVLAIDENSDLALVRDESIAVPLHPITTLASDIRVGEDLDIVGMPGRTWWSYTKASVSNLLPKAHAPNGKEMKMIQVQAPVWYGNSGGPAFNAAGQLVGISSMLSTKIPDRGYYVHLDAIDKFLQGNADGK